MAKVRIVNSLPHKESRIAVIGAGLSGLVAGFELQQRLPGAQINFFESSDSVGGVIQTESRDGFLLEHGADSFAVAPAGALDLCASLGLQDRLIEPITEHRRAFILRDQRMVPVPEGFALLRPTDMIKIMSSRLFSIRGRLRILAERFVKPRHDDEDESLESFALRRFGKEAFDRLIQPLVAGIYTADASKLSMRATMPQFVELEKKHGGMIRATLAMRKANSDDAARSASGARYSQFRSFPGGMAELFDALVQQIGPDAIHRQMPVESIQPVEPDRWMLRFSDGSQQEHDAVVVAVGAPVASRILAESSEQASALLGGISYASSALVLLGIAKNQVTHPLDGFGMVVPECERREIIAASFSSRKFAGRAPDNQHLIRVFIGGATQQHLLERSDDELIATAIRELEQIIGLAGTPSLQRVCRWNSAMPQYHVGHCEVREQVDVAISSHPGLELCGNALHGVGIAHCIRSARRAAERVVESLGER